MIEKQKQLEQTYTKNLESSRIIAEFKEMTQDEFELTVLKTIYLHKRASVNMMVGALFPRFSLEEIQEKLLACVEKDLLDFNPELDLFIMRWDLSEDVKDSMALFQYPLPMIVRPAKVRNNKECGYYTFKKSAMLHGYEEENDICLEHLNRINSVPYKLNYEIATTLKVEWSNVDKPRPGEDYKAFLERVKNYEKYCKDTSRVMELLKDETLYFTHNFDTRGRCYTGGYHITDQGTDFNKACLLFAEGEPLV